MNDKPHNPEIEISHQYARDSTFPDNPNTPPNEIDDGLFRLLAENIPTLCWMAKADGYIFWYNPKWHEYFGTTQGEMEGWGWQRVHDPEILPSVLIRWQQCIASGQPFEMTFPLKGNDGLYRPFLTRVRPYRDKDGTLTHWFGINIDVAEQHNTELRLLAANSALEAIAAKRDALLGQLVEGVIITDNQGHITFVNEAASQLHGVARLDVDPDYYARAYSLFTMSGEVHPTETLPLTRAIRNRETVINAHWRIRRSDGTEVLAIGNAQPYFATNGDLLGAVLTIRDDTKRYEAEIALADALKYKDILLNEVNHRVKNSLQLVTSMLRLQASKATDDDLIFALNEATSRVMVIAELHHSLYNTGLHDRVVISQYLEDITIKTVRALEGGNQVKLVFECADEPIVKVEHAVPLGLIVSELLTNAVKHATKDNETCEIRVSVSAQDDGLSVCIVDDGPGLPAGFDAKKSTSFGMRIITSLTKQIKGKMIILNPDKGTAILIKLPPSLFA